LVFLRDIRLGSLCILETRPRRFSPGDKAELREMADRVVTEIAAQELKALGTMFASRH
jgi:GAF domain-containing protein